MRYVSLSVLICTFFFTAIQAQSGIKDGSYDLSNTGELEIQISSGLKVELSGSDTQEMSYTYEFNGNDQAYTQYFENFNPRFSNENGYAQLVIEFPSNKGKNTYYEVEKNLLTITVPQNLLLQFNTRFSNISVRGMNNDVSVQNRSGALVFNNIRGMVQAENEFGDVSADDIEGDIYIRSRSSDIELDNIRGRADIDSQFSDMSLTNIFGQVSVYNRSGNIVAQTLSAGLDINSDFTTMEIADVTGDVKIQSKSGEVQLSTVGSFSFSGSFTPLDISRINGEKPVMIDSKSADVDLREINSDVIIRGSFLEISLENVTGNTQINNKNGSLLTQSLNGEIRFDGSFTDIHIKNHEGNSIIIDNNNGSVNLDAQAIIEVLQVSTTFGDVDINLNNMFSGSVELATSFGKIDQDIKLIKNTVNQSRNSTEINGMVGEGNGRMKVIVKHGDIKIRN